MCKVVSQYIYWFVHWKVKESGGVYNCVIWNVDVVFARFVFFSHCKLGMSGECYESNLYEIGRVDPDIWNFNSRWLGARSLSGLLWSLSVLYMMWNLMSNRVFSSFQHKCYMRCGRGYSPILPIFTLCVEVLKGNVLNKLG